MNETFRVGRALGLTFKIFFKNFIPFLLLSVLFTAPEFLYVWSKLGFKGEITAFQSMGDVIIFALAFLAISFGCMVLVVQTYAYGVVMELKGQHAGIGSTVAHGFSRFFPVLGVALLIGIMIAAVVFASSFVLGRMGLFGQIAVLCLWGLVYSVYFVAIPAAVIERPGAGGALTRSRELTMGHRGAIFAVLAMISLIKFLADQILQDTVLEDSASMEDALRKVMYIKVGIDVVLSMLQGVLASVAYYLLRNEKEGTSADELASVFE